MSQKVIIPVPDKGFDPTEVSVPWFILSRAGVEVVFSTETGKIAEADPLLIDGVIFGKLGAKPEVVQVYRKMEQDNNFKTPILYADIDPNEYSGIILPGGHAKETRQYLESQVLRNKVLEFWRQKKIIAAICHGVLVLARTLDPDSGKSLLYGKKVTALTKLLERSAYFVTAWKLNDYYRTYPAYVEDEIKRALIKPQDFNHGLRPWQPFTLEDGNLITARWPKDAYLFARNILKKLGIKNELSN